MIIAFIYIILGCLLAQEAEIGLGNEPCMEFRAELKARSTEFLVDSLSSNNSTQRLLAAYTLRERASADTEWAIPKLIDALIDSTYVRRDDPLYRCIVGFRHDGSSVSQEAAESVSYWEESALPGLVEAYSKYRYTTWHTARNILDAISRIDNPESYAILVDAANDEKYHNDIRYFALRFLGRLGSYDSYDVLLTYLHSNVRKLQEGAIAGLGYLRDPRAIGPLVELGQSDSYWKYYTFDALIQIDPTLGLDSFEAWEKWWAENRESARTIR